MFNYQKICQDTLISLPIRTKDIIGKRFGFVDNGNRQTLELIGREYNLSRERVRQIEYEGLKKTKLKMKSPSFQKVFDYFVEELKAVGFIRRNDLLLNQLGEIKDSNYIFFLLTLGDNFEKFLETNNFYSFWSINKEATDTALKSIDFFIKELERKKCLLSSPSSVNPFYFEISKYILKSPENLYGLTYWSEVNPKTIRDKVYLVLKKQEAPIHFNDISNLIDNLDLGLNPCSKKKSNPQTIHNELIKDKRFVLVGRGMYALEEWGYNPGTTREIIFKLLKNAKKSLSKKEILEKVLKQRLIKKSTILLNLNNKSYFSKDSKGRYTINNY